MATKKVKKKAVKKTKKAVKKKTDKKNPVEEILVEMQARFDALEEKVDALISKTALISRMVSTEQDSSFKTRATVSKKFPPVENGRPRERKMYKVVCAKCNANCEVPFMPKAGRPVYCKECFNERRNNNRKPVHIPDREELVAEITKTLNIDIDKPKKSSSAKTKAKTKVSKTAKTKKKTKAPKKKTAKKMKKK